MAGRATVLEIGSHLKQAARCANAADAPCAEKQIAQARAAAKQSKHPFDDYRATDILIRAYDHTFVRQFVAAQQAVAACDIGGVNAGLNGAFVSGAKITQLKAWKKGRDFNPFHYRLPEFATYLSQTVDKCGMLRSPEATTKLEQKETSLLAEHIAKIENPETRALVENVLATVLDAIDTHDVELYESASDLLWNAPISDDLKGQLYVRQMLAFAKYAVANGANAHDFEDYTDDDAQEQVQWLATNANRDTLSEEEWHSHFEMLSGAQSLWEASEPVYGQAAPANDGKNIEANDERDEAAE